MREKMGLSQEEVADAIKISRTAISQIENNERGVSSIELRAFSKLFEVSTDYILGLEKELVIILTKPPQHVPKQNMRITIPKINVEKFKQVLLYILEQCAGKPNIGKTVLYKLLYFSDFNYYETYEEQMTGVTYKKLQYGPIPLEFSQLVDSMEGKEIKKITAKYKGYPQERYLPLVKADLSKLRASEKEIIDKVLIAHSDKTATEISSYSHEDIPWKATKDKDIIDYELVFYRAPAYSVRSYPDEDSNDL
jgi:transcriptional regulator with XRE-family HTH domain